jgi:hypothetical protein
MKINFAYILSAIFAVGLVALGFTFFEISGERNRLKDELKNRSSLIAEEFNSDTSPLSENNLNDRKNVSDSLTGYFNLLGIASIYYNKDQFVPLGPDIEPYLEYSTVMFYNRLMRIHPSEIFLLSRVRISINI